MDAVQFLRPEHEKAKAAFGRLEQASGPERLAQWRQLRAELATHEEIEEACLYGPLAHDAEGRDERLAEWERLARHGRAESRAPDAGRRRARSRG